MQPIDQESSESTILDALDLLAILVAYPPNKWSETPAAASLNREQMRQLLVTLLLYLKKVEEHNKEELTTNDAFKGLRSIVFLVQQAAENLSHWHHYLPMGNELNHVTLLPEYLNLCSFYLNQIDPFLIGEATEPLLTPPAAGQPQEHSLFLKNLATIKEDTHYELLEIRQQDGSPFFLPLFANHLRALGQSAQVLAATHPDSAPWEKLQLLQIHELQESAQKMLQDLRPMINTLYKAIQQEESSIFLQQLKESIVALLLASDPKHCHLPEQGPNPKKSCKEYFENFQKALRIALTSHTYRKLEQSSTPCSLAHKIALQLIHRLCGHLFFRVVNREQLSASIRILAETSEEMHKEQYSLKELWSLLKAEDAHIRYMVRRYPNGTLIKTEAKLHQLSNSDSATQAFDPLLEGDLPLHLYTMRTKKGESVDFLRFPTPLKQNKISHAQIVEEWRGIMDKLTKEGKKHLLFNFQTRSNLQDQARSVALEHFASNPKYQDHLFVVTMPKYSHFYWQQEKWSEENVSAQDFLQEVQETLWHLDTHAEFAFPRAQKDEFLAHQLTGICSAIHRQFFHAKGQLSHGDRIIFIEILYFSIMMKFIETINPHSVSFTAKDTIDAGATSSAGFYALMKMTQNLEPWSSEEKEFLLWVLYGPALMLRHRAVNWEAFHRLIATFQKVHEEWSTHYEEKKADFLALFPEWSLDFSIQIAESTIQKLPPRSLWKKAENAPKTPAVRKRGRPRKNPLLTPQWGMAKGF